MHPISDKDLDKFFQKRFGEFEMEPSEAIWGRISETMSQTHKKKALGSFFWMAAASVIILISAGLWFYRPVEVIELRGDGEMVNLPLNSSELPLVNDGNSVNEDLKKEEELLQPQVKVHQVTVVPTIHSEEIHLPTSLPLEEPEIKLHAVKEVLVAEVVPAPKKTGISKPVDEPKVPNRHIGDLSTLDVTQPDMMAKAYLPEEESAFSDEEGRGLTKIRSVGSLLNFVIARVDKREDKLIEFKDGNEGSEISGINLGLVKIKGKK